MQLVREILTEPRCWRRMTDDHAPLPEDFSPEVREMLVYVVARMRNVPVALFVLTGMLNRAEVHFCMIPDTWGRARTVSIGKAFLGWVWRETSLDWLVGPVPAHNRLALRLAKACGFTENGEQRGCVTKGGRTYSRILMQVRRPDYAAV